MCMALVVPVAATPRVGGIEVNLTATPLEVEAALPDTTQPEAEAPGAGAKRSTSSLNR